MSLIKQLLSYAVIVAFLVYLFNQVRKPTRWIGQFFAWIMNFSHSALSAWGLSHVVFNKNFAVLDVGCGGGETVKKMAALAPEGKIYGIDYADGSVAVSIATNKKLIAENRVEIKEASVSKLPFPENMFDVVTSVETHYYWPDPAKDLQEILRVLKPGGTLMIAAESYKNGRYDRLQGPIMKLLRSVRASADDHRAMLLNAKYVNIKIFEEPQKGWLCCTGEKPR